MSGWPKPHKYKVAPKTDRTADGIVFDSKKEMRRYLELQLLLRAGEIRYLELQPRYEMVVEGHKICSYLADFRYVDAAGTTVVEDVKSAATRKLPVYRIKVKLLRALHGIEVREV